MLSRADLIKISNARLKDAEALLRCHRYDGAVYLCGYALELRLKARICRVLHWTDYPSTRSEFQDYLSFKTHDLDVLLRLAGTEGRIKAKHMAEWSTAAVWDPEVRYKPVGSATKQGAEDMIKAVKKLSKAL